MKKFLFYLSLAVIVMMARCSSNPPGAEIVHQGKDTTIVIERTEYYNLLEDYDIYSCYLMSSDGVNMVDSIYTYYVSGNPELQEVYFCDGTFNIYISNFQIQDLNLRESYNSFKWLSHKPDSIYYAKLAQNIDHSGISDMYDKFTGEWLYFSSYLSKDEQTLLTYEDFLYKVKGLNAFSIVTGFPWDLSTRILLGILSLIAVFLILSTRIRVYFRFSKSSENTG